MLLAYSQLRLLSLLPYLDTPWGCEPEGLRKGSERKKEVGKASMQRVRAQPQRGAGGSSGRDSLCLSAPIRQLKKSKVSRVAPTPFIGLTGVSSGAWAELPACAGSHLPLLGGQASPPGERNVAGQDQHKAGV